MWVGGLGLEDCSSDFNTYGRAGKRYSRVLIVLWTWSCRAVVCHSQLLTILFFLLQEDNKNFITLIAKHGSEMLVCGTGACNPTCWHLVSWSSALLFLVSFPVEQPGIVGGAA